jgi:hypothetical protein
MLELVSVLKQKFKDTLSELRAIHEADWTDETFQMELNKSIVIVEEAQSLYRKAMAKVDAAKWQKPDVEPSEKGFVGRFVAGEGEAHQFVYWLKMGLAFSLPLLGVLTLFFVLYLVLSGLVGGTV